MASGTGEGLGSAWGACQPCQRRPCPRSRLCSILGSPCFILIMNQPCRLTGAGYLAHPRGGRCSPRWLAPCAWNCPSRPLVGRAQWRSIPHSLSLALPSTTRVHLPPPTDPMHSPPWVTSHPCWGPCPALSHPPPPSPIPPPPHPGSCPCPPSSSSWPLSTPSSTA